MFIDVLCVAAVLQLLVMKTAWAFLRPTQISRARITSTHRFASDNGIKRWRNTNSLKADRDNQAELEQKYQELHEASKLSLAPMMEYTDRHFRHLVRLISSKTLLYTEMVAANALAHERSAMISEYLNENPQSDEEAARANYNDHFMRRYLGQAVLVPPLEGASVLQLGGSDPGQMYQAAQSVLEMTERGYCDYTAVRLSILFIHFLRPRPL